jgi:hypothetical protein
MDDKSEQNGEDDEEIGIVKDIKCLEKLDKTVNEERTGENTDNNIFDGFDQIMKDIHDVSKTQEKTLKPIITEFDDSMNSFQKFHKGDTGTFVSDALEYSSFPGDWSVGAVKLLREWMIRSSEKANQHVRAAKQCQLKHIYLMVPILLVSSIVSSLAFYTTGADNDGCINDSHLNAQIMLSFFAALLSFLNGVQSYFNFAEIGGKHMNTASKFLGIVKDLQVQVHLPANRMSDVEVVLSSMHDKLNDTVSGAPIL